MARAMLTHLARSESMTACGKKILYPEYLTVNPAEVSCGSCGRRGPKGKPTRKSRSIDGYPDPDQKGVGLLHCLLCDRPYRDHDWPPMPCQFVAIM